MRVLSVTSILVCLLTSGVSAVKAFSAIATAIDAFAQASPYGAAFLSCAINGAAADVIAQTAEQMKQRRASGAVVPASADAISARGGVAVAYAPNQSRGLTLQKRRTLAFILYGGLYQGMSLHFIYNDLFTRWFGPARALEKVFVSQAFMAPLLTLPVAYLFRGVVFGKSIKAALQDYWVGLSQKGLLFSFWKLWVPIQVLFFTVIPVHLRIPFSSFFSLCWTIILSFVANSE